MQVLKNIWSWLDGKKTAIGAIISLITAYLIARGWIGEAEQMLLLGLSALVVGGGLLHKVKKQYDNV